MVMTFGCLLCAVSIMRCWGYFGFPYGTEEFLKREEGARQRLQGLGQSLVPRRVHV